MSREHVRTLGHCSTTSWAIPLDCHSWCQDFKFMSLDLSSPFYTQESKIGGTQLLVTKLAYMHFSCSQQNYWFASMFELWDSMAPTLGHTTRLARMKSSFHKHKHKQFEANHSRPIVNTIGKTQSFLSKSQHICIFDIMTESREVCSSIQVQLIDLSMQIKFRCVNSIGRTWRT